MAADGDDTTAGGATPRPLATLEGLSDGGIAALHAKRSLPIALAPSTEDDKTRNTVRAPLAPVACWRLNDARFGFDSSFVHPDAQPEFGELADLVEGQPQAPLSVFGHADPTGTDDYNKKLSGRRARAVYAVLARRADVWEELYSEPYGGDDWKQHRWVDLMVQALGYDPSSADDVKRFQTDHGCSADGVVGPKTRAALYPAYMEFLCARDGKDPFKLDASRFLGRGEDPDGKGDYQGCSDFNPVVVFSAADEQDFALAGHELKRNNANSPNRRVLAYLFAPGTTITSAKWPCPTSKAAGSDCKKRFWSDAKDRRAPGDAKRTFPDDRNTFACRFYHGLAMRSPCEKLMGNRRIRLRLLDPFGYVMADEPCFVTVADAQRRAVSDDQGIVETTIPDGAAGVRFLDGRYGLVRSDPAVSYDFAQNGPPAAGSSAELRTGARSHDDGPWGDVMNALEELAARYGGPSA